jgi:hypothetical protein
MSWSVAIKRSQKSRVLLAYSNPSRNRKRMANTACLMRRFGYGVFATDIAWDAENA